jgi:hypothetical protein
MKKTLMLVMILAIAVFISGCGSSTISENPVMEDKGNSDDEIVIDPVVPQDGVITQTVTETKLLVDKNKYLTGGRENFDTAEIFFTQKAGKGFEIEVDAGDDQINLEVMTDKNCLLNDKGLEYELILNKQGVNVKVTSDDLSENDRNICVQVGTDIAKQVVTNIKVTELTFA